MYLLQMLIFMSFALCSPVITFGGGLIISNALTLTGLGLITATGVTLFYFLTNALTVIVIFWKNIIWKEVRIILPLATVGSIVGGILLTKISSTLLLTCMLYFALQFLYTSIRGNREKEGNSLSSWILAFFSGFLASGALPGGGLRNSYLLSRGYSLAEVHATTQMIGVIGWAINLYILFHAKIVSIENLYGVWYALPFLILINIILRRGLLHVPKSVSKKVSFILILLFCVYAIGTLVMHLK